MRFLEVVKISLLVLFSAPVSAGVVLSEIMFDPLEDEDTDEFVELYNDSSLPVNLAGWVVADGDGSDTLVDAGFGMMAAPRQFILILDPDYIEEASTTYDSLVPENALVVIIVGSTFGSRGFSNGDSEQISLVNANGQTVATRAYSTGNTPGHSDEKRVMNGGDDDENWMDCETLHGTPGFRNSVTPLDRNLGIVEIEADPDAPAAGSSFSISVSVVNSGLQGMNGSVDLRFDDSGGTNYVEAEQQPLGVIAQGDSVFISFSLVMPGSGIARYEAALVTADDDTSDNHKDLLVSSSPIAGGLIINEIQYAPASGRAEWVELFNASPNAIASGGMTFADGRGIADSTERTPLPNWLLPSGGLALLAGDSAIFFEAIPDSIPVHVWDNAITLNNSGDSLCVWNGDELLDRVDYGASWGGGDAGISLERISATAESNDQANWADCVDASGSTPGRMNSRSVQGDVPSAAGLSVSPDPFTPNGDSVDEVAVITYRAGRATSAAAITIYDIRGRVVRELHSPGSASGGGSVIWDGRADDERMLPTARYVLLLEATPADGGGEITTKSTVILARPR